MLAVNKCCVLGRKWKKMIVTYCMEGLWKLMITSDRISGLRAEIGIVDLLNMKQVCG
jgi:hypothetical protein